MTKIIEFPAPDGVLLWITGSLCEHCDCSDCRSRNGKLFNRGMIQSMRIDFKPPLHEDCDCQLIINTIGEEKDDYRHYKPGIRRIRKLRLDE